MDFERLDYNPYFTVGFFGLIIALFIALILAANAWDLKYSPNRKSASPKKIEQLNLFAVALAIAGSAAFTVMVIINNASNGANEGKATQNLMEKYEIQKVRWDAPETEAHAVTVDREDNLLVETSNGQLYIFKYTVDKATSEPILKNMPIHGGNTPDASTSAEALLKK